MRYLTAVPALGPIAGVLGNASPWLVGSLLVASLIVPLSDRLLAWQQQRLEADRAHLVNQTLASIADPHERLEALARFEPTKNASPTQSTSPQFPDPDPPEP
ncbi:hypothetical protein ACFXJ5_08795 [Streptomyces sp. NPDC059373]